MKEIITFVFDKEKVIGYIEKEEFVCNDIITNSSHILYCFKHKDENNKYLNYEFYELDVKTPYWRLCLSLKNYKCLLYYYASKQLPISKFNDLLMFTCGGCEHLNENILRIRIENAIKFVEENYSDEFLLLFMYSNVDGRKTIDEKLINIKNEFNFNADNDWIDIVDDIFQDYVKIYKSTNEDKYFRKWLGKYVDEDHILIEHY